jgi:tryptophan synthase alpha chain
MVAEKSRGFVYLTSVAGVTGARDRVPEYLPDFIGRVRQKAHQPLAVGFGVSSAEQAAAITRYADGVIIGSRLLQLIDEDSTLAKLEEFVIDVRSALDGI